MRNKLGVSSEARIWTDISKVEETNIALPSYELKYIRCVCGCDELDG